VPERLPIALRSSARDDAPDERARREYRARLDDLRAELDEAEQCADSGRAELLRAELDELVAQLAERFGRRAARRGPVETARKAVTKVLRTQIGKLLDVHPTLGRHLRDTMRLGRVCVYAPPTPVEWDVLLGEPVPKTLDLVLALESLHRAEAGELELLEGEEHPREAVNHLGVATRIFHEHLGVRPDRRREALRLV
jgi:soluble cytochrome b562